MVLATPAAHASASAVVSQRGSPRFTACAVPNHSGYTSANDVAFFNQPQYYHGCSICEEELCQIPDSGYTERQTLDCRLSGAAALLPSLFCLALELFLPPGAQGNRGVECATHAC